MTHREAQELRVAYEGLFGRFLKNLLTESSQAVARDAVEMLPASQYESIEREQLFGRSKAFQELITLIPLEIDKLLKQTENDNTNE